MSTIYRDYLAPARARWALNSATFELFKKSWGTSWIDGVQVYNERMVYWQGAMVLNPTQKRFINKIGISYEELANQNYQGLDYAYFKLNSAKYTYEPMDMVQIAQDLDSSFNINDEFEVAVSYGGDLKRFVSTFVTDDGSGGYTVDTVAIRAMLNSDKIKYFANASLEQAGFGIVETTNTIYAGTNTTPLSTPVTKLAFNDIKITTEVTVTTRVVTMTDVIYTYHDTLTEITTEDRNIQDVAPAITTKSNTTIELISVVENINNLPVGETITVGNTITTVNDRSIYDCLAMIDNGTTFDEIGIRNEVVKAVRTTDQYGNITIVGEYSYILRFKVISTPTQASYITTTCSSLANTLVTAFTYTGTSYFSVTNAALDTLIKQAVFLMNNASSHPAFYNGYLRVDYCESIKRKDFVEIFGKIFDSGYKVHETSSSWFEKVVAIVIIIVAIVLAYIFTPMVAAIFLSVGTVIYSMAFPEATDMIKLLGGASQIMGYAAIITGIYAGSISAYFMGAAEAARLAGLNEKYVILIQLAGAAAGYYQNQQQELARAAAEKTAVNNGLTGEAVKAAGENAMQGFRFDISEVVKSIGEAPSDLIDKISNINISSVMTDIKSVTMGDASGWMDNLNKAMELYSVFFVTPFVIPMNSEDQSQREDGVEEYYLTMNMLDDSDLLNRMSEYKENMFGGKATLNYLTLIG